MNTKSHNVNPTIKLAFEDTLNKKNDYMKSKILILCCLVITTYACNNNDDTTDINIDGDYVGTFERDNIVSNVELNLTSSEFSGTSDRTNFPAIYFGNFSVQKNAVTFNNEQLIITTEFDPDLVLDGIWNYDVDNGILTMTNSIGDIYILTKE